MGNAKIIPPTDALLLPYQKRWVLDNSRLKLMEKSRQIGISWASAYSMVRRKSLAKVRATDGDNSASFRCHDAVFQSDNSKRHVCRRRRYFTDRRFIFTVSAHNAVVICG